MYSNLVRRAFPGLPVVLGGIEASLRRASHYDFWTDSLRRSILLDSKADVLVYGMGETALEELVLAANTALERAGTEGAALRAAFADGSRYIRGTAFAVAAKEVAALVPEGAIRLPSHEEIETDPFQLVTATVAMERQVHQGKFPAWQVSGDRAVIMNPPSPPLETEAMDALYDLPYTRLPHPSYAAPIPAWEMIRTSITSHRGCGGGCAFCSLALHQTRHIASRGKASILAEARRIASTSVRGKGQGKIPAWAGSISDIGGPSANMWQAECAGDAENCTRASCLFPSVCRFFAVDQAGGAAMLREAAGQEGVRHVRVASGVRYDLALRDREALEAYTREFTGGQLKIAPEHIAEEVLRLMRKPPLAVFEEFLRQFERLSHEAGKEQYVIPYLISAYPGCTDKAMRDLAAWLRKRNWSPRQVQCFIPTPGTVATAMYYAGRDTGGNPIPVARTDAERMRQHYILLGGEKEPSGGTRAKPQPSGNGPNRGRGGRSGNGRNKKR